MTKEIIISGFGGQGVLSMGKILAVVSDKGVEKALFKTLPERHHHLIPLNMEAIKAGREIITKQ